MQSRILTVSRANTLMGLKLSHAAPCNRPFCDGHHTADLKSAPNCPRAPRFWGQPQWAIWSRASAGLILNAATGDERLQRDSFRLLPRQPVNSLQGHVRSYKVRCTLTPERVCFSLLCL